MLMIFILIPVFLLLGIYFFVRQASFGRLPSGPRAERIGKSEFFRDGKFQNLSFTPELAEGVSYTKVFRKFFFGKGPRNKPPSPLPSVKTDLRSISPQADVLVWFGHSSYFLQLDGKKILVDPVLSGHASPVTFTTPSFPGSDVFEPEDFPDIDLLVITHDHWDHLDFSTIGKLRPKVKKIITGLGTGEHLERWGFDRSLVEEMEWNQVLDAGSGFRFTAVPARHFSGRGLKRNQAMWMSFALKTPSWNLFLGGDSGYDTHFLKAGKELGPFDLAILECGQYNEFWKYIHMMPEEVVQAAQDLGAKKLLPVHWGKFALSVHDWDEPIKRVTAEAEKRKMPVLHPRIGELVDLRSDGSYTKWWEEVG
jgi:L-ascorbate metabolism protein UlaG (beta-lactamase superfamily)